VEPLPTDPGQSFDWARRVALGPALRGVEVQELLATPKTAPVHAPAAVYALGNANIRRRHEHLAVVGLVEILRDESLPVAVREHVPEAVANALSNKQRKLQRFVIRSLIHALYDESPDVRFWSAFGLSLLGSRDAKHHLRKLTKDRAMGSFWTVGEEASDALDIIEGRRPPDREPVRGAAGFDSAASPSTGIDGKVKKCAPWESNPEPAD
jgi:hypothetical protein